MTRPQIDQELWDKQWRYLSVPLHKPLSTMRTLRTHERRDQPPCRMPRPCHKSHQSSQSRNPGKYPRRMVRRCARVSSASTVTYRSFPLLERRRLPTGIFQRFLGGSHGILSEPSHLPLVLPNQVHYPQHKYPKAGRDNNNHHVHLCLAIPKPSNRPPAGDLQVPQRQSDKASPRTEHHDASH